MILEIVTSTLMGGVLAYTFLDTQGVTEGSRLQHIANHCGLKVKDSGKTYTIHLLRKRKHTWGNEYVYRIPLGLSFDDVLKKKAHFEDGLNHKRGLFQVSLSDFKQLQLRVDIVQQIKRILNGPKHRKEIIMDYDGTLIIRVYKDPMPEYVPFDESTLESCNGWKVCVGQSREGMIYHDFDKIPHMVVAGITRYGKSVFLKNMITTLLHNQPKSARLTLIDLKGGLAFNRYSNVRQVVTVAKDAKESLEALRGIHEEMKQKQQEFLAKGFEDVTEAKSNIRHFIIIDEGAELASQGDPDGTVKKIKVECEHIVAEIARIGGGLGYRLIFATQYPTADTLPRQVKQNANAKVCFLLDTEIASRVVLDEPGAESLPFIKGRAIYRTDRKQIVQTPLIENPFIDQTIRPHIVFKPRKEQQHEHPASQNKEGRGYSMVIERTRLSQSKSAAAPSQTERRQERSQSPNQPENVLSLVSRRERGKHLLSE